MSASPVIPNSSVSPPTASPSSVSSSAVTSSPTTKTHPPSGVSIHLRGPATKLAAPVIRDATAADALALSNFARQAFIDSFGHCNDAKHIEEYVSSAYSEEIQRSEITDSAVRTFIADRDGAVVGFAMVRDGEVPECVKDSRAIEIQRLYGVGVGNFLMRRCLDYANGLKRSTWLGVEGRNERAVNFYLKSGFVEVGTHTFRLGSDPQTDLVLERPMDAAK